MTASSCLQAQGTKPGTKIENCALQVCKCQSFEWIQRIVPLSNLPLELGVEELDGFIRDHVAVTGKLGSEYIFVGSFPPFISLPMPRTPGIENSPKGNQEKDKRGKRAHENVL